MVIYWLKLAVGLVLILAGFILAIRSQPYQDRVRPALAQLLCAAPCFMGIRPGVTSLQAAVAMLAAHEWVDKSMDEFPSLVRDAVLFGAGIPRTLIDWRWTDAPPAWINQAQPGILTVEDQAVLNIRIPTHFSLGEILLALGQPDQEQFSAAPQFQYNAWYARENLLISAESGCPNWHYYALPVQIRFLSTTPYLETTRTPCY